MSNMHLVHLHAAPIHLMGLLSGQFYVLGVVFGLITVLCSVLIVKVSVHFTHAI